MLKFTQVAYFVTTRTVTSVTQPMLLTHLEHFCFYFVISKLFLQSLWVAATNKL